MMVIRARIPAGGRRPRVSGVWANLCVMWTRQERGVDLRRDPPIPGMNWRLSTRRLLTDSRGELAYLLKTGGPFPHLLIDLVSRVDNR